MGVHGLAIAAENRGRQNLLQIVITAVVAERMN